MKSLKEKIKQNELVVGSWITLANPAIAEIMARAGFDWLSIDLEHSVITIREAEELIRICSLSGIPPLVRLTSNNSEQIKRLMDAGAHGIIVPMINSKEDAERAVSSVHYPPRGTRGVGLARAQQYGSAFESYKAWLKNESLVVVQIEHIKAVENMEAILSVEGVDAYIVGPYDLSASLGIPGEFQNPKFVDAMKHIQTLSKKLTKAGGFHVVEPDPERFQQHLKEGYTFMAYSLDIRMLDVSCRQGLNAIRSAK